MKAGTRVKFVEAGGDEHAAHVTEVTGTGDSLYKVVSLVYGDVHVRDVPHENDVERGKDGKPTQAYWRETGAARRQEMLPTAPVPGGGVPSGAPFIVPPEPEDETETEPAPKRRK